MAKFKVKHLPKLLKQAYQQWNSDDPWALSASVAYYALFSLPALLVIVVNVAGSIFGTEAVQGQIQGQIGSLLGKEAGAEVQKMIKNAYESKATTVATIISIATLIFGATGVFFQLQKALNRVWGVRAKTAGGKAGIMKLITDRATGFGLVIVIAFLLLISLLLTTAISALSDYITANLPDWTVTVFYILEIVISLGIITVLFAIIFRFLPDVDIQWRTVWFGAFFTALLFMIGKFALGLYFGKTDPSSTYGAAGSVVLILLWISYSCLILFFGAEFTQVYAKFYGHPIQPSEHAERFKVVTT